MLEEFRLDKGRAPHSQNHLRMIEFLSQLAFALLVVHLIRIIHASTRVVHRLTRINHFGKELDVLVILLSNHNGVLQMEMNEHHNLVLTRLKHGVLDVVVHDIDNFIALRNKAKAVGVRLQVSLRLLSGDHGTHGQIRKTVDSLVLDSNQLFLFDQGGLLLFSEFTGAGSLSEFRDLSKSLLVPKNVGV